MRCDAEITMYLSHRCNETPAPADPKQRHRTVVYLRPPYDQLQRWPSDPDEEQRLQEWRDNIDTGYDARAGPPDQLTWYSKGPTPWRHDSRPDRAQTPPKPPPSNEPHYPGLRATQNDAVPDFFKELHATFQAPFASPEWVNLVNWRRREGERHRLAYGELDHLMDYLGWAEGHHANIRGRGSVAYSKWLPSPEEEKAATEAQHDRIIGKPGTRRLLNEMEAMYIEAAAQRAKMPRTGP
jgi:hypothetical protein